MRAITALIAFLLFLSLSAFPSFAANLLSNPGFEDGAFSWSKFGGILGTSSSIVNSGTTSATLTSTTQSTKWIYQVVSVTGGVYYDFSGYAVKNDNNISSILLRVSWYSSADGSGLELSHNDSTTTLTDNNSSYQSLSTGSLVAPDGANSTKAKTVVAFSSVAQAVAYFDDFVFQESIAPTATPVPPTPTSLLSTPTPVLATATPKSNTPTPTKTSTATKSPTPAPSRTPTPKPSTSIALGVTEALLSSPILGESTESGSIVSPTETKIKKNILVSNKSKSPNNNFQKILIFVGVVFIAICAILIFREIKKRKFSQNE